MTKFATVISDGLNVRANPHSKAKIITSLKKGARVPVLGRDESTPGYVWLKVGLDISLHDGRAGWIYSKYVNVASNVPDFEPVEIPIPDTSLAKMVAWVVGIIAVCSVLAYCVR